MSSVIHVLFATASGNAESLALAAAERLGATGHRVRVENLADFSATELGEVQVALLIVSTWGEGEPPPDAAEFFAELAGPSGFRLESLRYAVLALGSSGYRDFCGCGRRLDENLARRGAQRLLPRVECDTKFKAAFETWIESVGQAVEAQTK